MGLMDENFKIQRSLDTVRVNLKLLNLPVGSNRRILLANVEGRW